MPSCRTPLAAAAATATNRTVLSPAAATRRPSSPAVRQRSSSSVFTCRPLPSPVAACRSPLTAVAGRRRLSPTVAHRRRRPFPAIPICENHPALTQKSCPLRFRSAGTRHGRTRQRRSVARRIDVVAVCRGFCICRLPVFGFVCSTPVCSRWRRTVDGGDLWPTPWPSRMGMDCGGEPP